MNYFTKDELGELEFILGQWCYPKGNYPNSETILKKIQSMLDNYCEHECNGEAEIFIDTCRKCNAYLLRDSHNDNQ